MPRLLLVDDNAMNLQLMRAYLNDCGYTLSEASSGEQALELAAAEPPDLVLLDVMMPGINGFETTRRLKELRPDEYMPVVLVSALNDQSSRQLGLRVGADDYLSRPVDRIELLGRVANLLALRENRATLARKNVELAELHRFRDEMSAMIVHDLKNPLSVIVGGLSFATEEQLPEVAREALDDAQSAARRIELLLANLVDLSRLEASRFPLRRRQVGVLALFEPIIRPRQRLAQTRDVHIELDVEPALRLDCDAELVTRVLENLLDNGLRYAPTGGVLSAGALRFGDRIELRVGNSGPPIPPEARALIFEKFGQATAAAGRMNLGLGLYFCRLVAEAHGGRIWVEETAALPTVFVLSLPQ